MSFENPTPLQVGARGEIHGWKVKVAGRVVLGVEIGGERYYWNEFNLVDDQGNSGTLVYEEGDDGPEWKLFQMITPRQPLTVAEAMRKKVGDQVNFTGEPIPITMVDRSRVYHIEGTAPEGVEVGDLADYLNADGGEHMYVASWTGRDIEFYEGRDVPAPDVAKAFRLSKDAPPFIAGARQALAEEEETSDGGSSGGGIAAQIGKRITAIVIALLAASSIFSGRSCFSGSGSFSFTSDAPRPKQPAPALRLAVGASGTLEGKAYTVGNHALVEVGRVAGRYDRREYQLTAEARGGALLIQGLTAGKGQWHLLRPATPVAQFTPYEAAARRKGAQLNFGGQTATVTELFLSDTRAVDGGPASAGAGGRLYGFLATSGNEQWLARWNESDLFLYRGTPLDEKAVLAAFGPSAAPPK